MRTILALSLCCLCLAAEAAAPAPVAAAAASEIKPRKGVPVAAWDCGTMNPNTKIIKPAAGKATMTGDGAPDTFEKRDVWRLKDGQTLVAKVTEGPLADGGPFAIEIEVVPDGTLKGVRAGLIQSGHYLKSGIRMMLLPDLKVTIEHFAGDGQEKATYITTAAPLAAGKMQTVRYEHDGVQGRIFVDGVLSSSKDCPPCVPWKGDMLVGKAGGKDYWFFGTVGRIVLSALPAQR
jgi:hypothetical protein